MTQVSRSRHYEMPPDVMWGRVGDFHRAHTWHPAVAASESREGGEVRVLTLQDGAKIVETRTEAGEHSYGYRIDESPLPVRDYHATFAVRDAADGCDVVWTAEFEPEGASEGEARQVVEGIFDAGLDNL